MKWIFFVILLPLASYARFQEQDGVVKAWGVSQYPIEYLIRDLAEIEGKAIMVEDGLLKRGKKINFILNQDASKKDFRDKVLALFHSQGYTFIENKSFYRVIHTRDTRYDTFKLYTDESFPRNSEKVHVEYTMKYPRANEVSRGLRPFMGRYGRIITFNDSHSIIISDTGRNSARIIDLIKQLDIPLNKQKNYSEDKVVSYKQKKQELELELLELQKKKITQELEAGTQERH